MIIGKKTLGVLFVATMVFSGCVGPDDFVFEGENYGAKRSEPYKDGVIAGCKTAKGNYKKDHESFNTIKDYNDGWFAGRRRCQGAIW